MKKKLLKILIYVSILSMLLTLCTGFASAVDPVSAATMANALAQAITAYGASQGVSMTFDVASTDGIGEGVHELWNEFKEDIQDNNVPTYDSLAVTMWADIYTKIGNNIGININDTEMPYIDAFWNWLLSGPAEMTKVDNEYFEWTLNQDNTVSPINIHNISVNTLNGYNLTYTNRYDFNPTDYALTFLNGNASNLVSTYWVQFQNTDSNYYICIYSDVTSTNARMYYNGSPSTTYNFTYNNNAAIGYYYGYGGRATSYPGIEIMSKADWLSMHNTLISSSTADPESEFSNYYVRPYVGDPVPEKVYIPDNEDVNYSALPYLGGIDQLWDTSRFGDGTGTLTDAQKQAIADTVDNAITENPDKTIELADDSPLPAPNEVYIPFLPLQLPSFNFSLSGIWHYVVTWVGTLGSWFTAMFNMWSCLPYAMVVPVYATLVVVIVLGVYRRFLS